MNSSRLSFGNLVLLGAVLVLASPASHAATEKVTCLLSAKQYDQRNFESFELSISSNTARITEATLSKSFIDGIQQEIKNAKDRVAKSPDGEDPLKIRERIALLEKLLGKSGSLALSGDSVPYKKAPASPRIRYSVRFDDKALDQEAIVGELGPEVEKVMVFVFLDKNGSPKYDKITLEYDGTQGPYFDHYECK